MNNLVNFLKFKESQEELIRGTANELVKYFRNASIAAPVTRQPVALIFPTC